MEHVLCVHLHAVSVLLLPVLAVFNANLLLTPCLIMVFALFVTYLIVYLVLLEMLIVVELVPINIAPYQIVQVILQLANSHVLAIVLFVAVLLFVPHVITIIILTTQTDVPNAQQVVDLAFNAILHNHQIVYLLVA